MASEPIIELADIEKSYGEGKGKTQVLRGVSLTVDTGDLVALIGQSGSGKSTLLNIIGGLDEPDSGKVRVNGLDYGRTSEADLARIRNRDIGFIFQAFNLLDHLDCLGNVILPGAFSDADTSDAEDRGNAALERVGLGKLARRRPSELSGGQKQRVAIARALFNRPKLLLCDEPTGNLDSDTGREVIDFFRELNRDDGVTLLIVTHETRVSETADRIIKIEDGVIIDDHRPEGKAS